MTATTLYVGPYIELKPTTLNAPIEISSCPNPECENNGVGMDSNYCPNCGSKVVEIPINMKMPFDPWFLLDEAYREFEKDGVGEFGDIFTISEDKTLVMLNIPCMYFDIIPQMPIQNALVATEEVNGWKQLINVLKRHNVQYVLSAGVIAL